MNIGALDRHMSNRNTQDMNSQEHKLGADKMLKELINKLKVINSNIISSLDYPYRMEYIGKYLKVLKSLNNTCVGIEGLVVEETKNTLRILDSRSKANTNKYRIVTVFKKGSIFNIQGHVLNGDWISRSPEDRVNANLDIYKIKSFNKLITNQLGDGLII